jgi:beta-1,4-mannosyltransferase
VQQSFPKPRPTTNPYLIQLAEQLSNTDGVELRTFSWKSALRTDYDVFHVHWPENLPKGNSWLKSLGRRMFTRVLLLRLRLKRIPIVRTMHNLDRPEGRSRAEYRILDRIDKQTALVIRLNELTEVTAGTPVETIPHGHYRDWFAQYSKADRIASRLGFFGLVRRYKNVAHLVEVHAQLPAEFTLSIGGNPSSAELSTEIERARAGNDRVRLDFHFLTDAELVTIVTEAELIVLPYTEMHNSGSVLTSLSLERPVLVQDNEVNRALAAEVGAPWVQLYSGVLTPEDVISARLGIQQISPGGVPDLHLRNWGDVGPRHVEAYRRAIAVMSRAR